MDRFKYKGIYHQRPLVVLSTRSDHQPDYNAFRAIAKQAREYGWELLDLRFTRGALPDYRTISGAIVDCLPTDPVAKQLLAMKCPVVRLGKLPHPKDNIIPAVLPDNQAGGRLAAEHFAERGFRHIGYAGRIPWGNFKSTYDAYNARAAELDCKCHLLRLRSSSSMDTALKHQKRSAEIGKWLLALPKPAGLFSFSDLEAAMICTVCRQVELSVPEDIAVLGSGNSSLNCDMAPVPLSSIDWATEECGAAAAGLLRSLIEGSPAPKEPVMVPPKGIVSRRSTDMLAVKDPTVARAVRFIWDHLKADISVNDVVNQVKVGRRQLERAFKIQMGHGIAAELRRKRLELSCEILRMTDARISDIAAEVGFKSADHLHLAFRQTHGMTPRQYRIERSC